MQHRRPDSSIHVKTAVWQVKERKAEQIRHLMVSTVTAPPLSAFTLHVFRHSCVRCGAAQISGIEGAAATWSFHVFLSMERLYLWLCSILVVATSTAWRHK